MIGIEEENGAALDESRVRDRCAAEISKWKLRGKRVLLVAPDHTRTAPIGLMFRLLHGIIGPQAAAFDVLIALGTHPPMSEDGINERFGLTFEDRTTVFSQTKFYNHRWDDSRQLVSIGTISEDEVASISGGLMRERVDVTINRLALEYDLLMILGPTFPHEVVGFSGGNKYLFPGISGKEIIDMFHWLGALITNSAIIGTKYTPVRAIVDRAAAMVPTERKCASLIVNRGSFVGLYLGGPEEAWNAAADLSSQLHVVRKPHPFHSVLSCAPTMYDELWVGGKCAYKLERVVADGGELIIYAPHISRVSVTHGEQIQRIGYHVRDYFLAQMPRFADVPRGVMAHSTHVKGAGTYVNGVERPRIHVTLATGIGEAECRAVNLGYRDYRTIDPSDWKGREPDGVLYVPKAGETLYRLSGSLFSDRKDTSQT
jgi:nickel-dependent lactate racemase